MISFVSKNFQALTTEELYKILALRAEVFVVEQNCPYQDVDGKDLQSIHVLGYIKNQLVAYARVLGQGVSYQEYPSLGRIVTSRSIRGKNFGHDLVNFSIKVCQKNFPGQPIKISAQAHLEMFYNKHKFKATGEAYLEDDIPHIGMILLQE
ncbi:MAG: GNAT family N-acetyltransferase [Flavobacteriaceae bacterium]|nr:GNAT family N-acetyltransferase [Flavobacteriaceae bacterium]